MPVLVRRWHAAGTAGAAGMRAESKGSFQDAAVPPSDTSTHVVLRFRGTGCVRRRQAFALADSRRSYVRQYAAVDPAPEGDAHAAGRSEGGR